MTSVAVHAGIDKDSPRFGALNRILLRTSLGQRLFAIMLMAGVLRAVCYQGIQFSDDFALIEQAWRVFHGEFAFGQWRAGPLASIGATNYPQRLGIIYPLAWLFRTIGINEIAVAILPFLTSWVLVLATYWAAKRMFSPRAGLLAGLVMSVLPIPVVGATILRAQYPSMAVASIALAMVAVSISTPPERHFHAWSIGSGALLFAAYLMSEEVAFCVPWLVALLAWCVVRRKARPARFLLEMGFTCVTLICFELFMYHRITGDAFFRLHQMQLDYTLNTNLRMSSFASLQQLGWKATLHRLLLTGPLALLLTPGYACIGLLGVLASARALHYKDRRFAVAATWFMAVALSFNFGSVSFSSYRPLNPEVHRLLIVLFPAVLMVGGMLDDLFEKSAQTGSESQFWGTAVLGLLLVASVGQLALIARGGSLRSPQRYVARFLRPHDVLYTDGRTLDGVIFYRGMNPSTRLRNFDYADLSHLAAGSYVLVNQPTLAFLRQYYSYVPPPLIEKPPKTWKPVWARGGALLYRVVQPAIL